MWLFVLIAGAIFAVVIFSLRLKQVWATLPNQPRGARIAEAARHMARLERDNQ